MRLLAVPLLLLTISICCGEDAAPAKLDRFNLANGRTIIGTIESQTDEAYTIKLVGGAGGTIIMKKDRVLSIDARAADPPAPRPPKEPGADDESAAQAKKIVAKPAKPVDPIAALRSEAKAKGVNVTIAMGNFVKERSQLKGGINIKDVIEILGNDYTWVEWQFKKGDYSYTWANKDGSKIMVFYREESQRVGPVSLGFPSLSP